MSPRTFRAVAAAALLALLLAGCDKIFEKGRGNEAQAAEKKIAAGDFRGAAALYEAALDGTAKTAEVHYKLALLYDDKLKQPLDALHHMLRYLELTPNGARARDAKAYKKEGETKLLAQLGKGSPMTQQEAVRLKNENQLLRDQLTALRAQKALPAATMNARGEAVQKAIPPGARTHTVQPGETLSMIAQKYFRNKGRWKDIQDANFNALEGTVKIRPGMTLIIP